MTVKLRLARGGSKKHPFYRIVAADERAPRDGRYIERLGYLNPLLPRGHAERHSINDVRLRYWLGVGAQPSERLHRLLTEANLMPARAIPPQTKKNQPKSKAQERLQADKEKLAVTESAPQEEAPAAEAADSEATPAEISSAENPPSEIAADKDSETTN